MQGDNHFKNSVMVENLKVEFTESLQINDYRGNEKKARGHPPFAKTADAYCPSP